MQPQRFYQPLLQWYHQHQRSLPWRLTSDPYRIWLSEIILQQTRVAQGLSYYQAFETAFPTVHELARATETEVLRLWQGLGYYTRARNLHACAKKIVHEFKGHFPRQYEQLLPLPGVGPYTAAAIASIAFNEAVPVVDGNVFRVLARVFGIALDINRPATRKVFFEKAKEVMDGQQPGTFNQALMELGALCCVPANPRCPQCPLQNICVARSQNIQHLLPVKEKKAPVRKRYFYYFVIQQGGRLLMRQRNGRDIWQGLFDFYCCETRRPTAPARLLQLEAHLHGLEIRKAHRSVRHLLTHQQLNLVFLEAEAHSSRIKPPPGYKWYTPPAISQLPKPVVIDQFLRRQGWVK